MSSIHCDEDRQGKVLNSLPNVLNPPGFRQKGVTNKRFESIVERNVIKSNGDRQRSCHYRDPK